MHKKTAERFEQLKEALHRKAGMPPRCISYDRFSDPHQEAGDSTRRQYEAAQEAARLEGLPLDETLTLSDHGISAFRGRNWKKGDLGKFLDLVEAGLIHAGWVLIIERVSRLSRLPWMRQVELWKEILSHGIVIRTCVPPARYTAENINDLTVGCPVVMFMMLANMESAQKSDMIGKAWGQKKKMAQERKEPHGQHCPAWIVAETKPHPDDPKRLVTTGYHLHPDRWPIIVRMVEWYEAEIGDQAIARKLREEGTPAWGYSGDWSEQYVKKILRGRAILGEYQPYQVVEAKEGGNALVPFGEPIQGYYPAIPGMDEDRWQRLQVRRKGNRGRGGRRTYAATNLFTHLVYEAGDEARMHLWQRGSRGTRNDSLVVRSDLRRGFEYTRFERKVLAVLAVLKAADVDGHHVADALTARAEALQKERTELDLDLAALNAQMDEVPPARWPKGMVSRVADLEEKIKAKEAELQEAQAAANSSGRTQVLTELKTALQLLDEVHGTEKEAVTRQRIKARIPMIVESIWVRIQKTSQKSKYVHVRLYLKGGEPRPFVITYGDPKCPPLDLADADFRAGSERHYHEGAELLAKTE